MLSARGETRRGSHPGFTLIELLVVILIIAVVISITIPAVGHARDLAKRTETQSMLGQLQQACGQFINSERRTPGYFSVKDMGSTDNDAAPTGRGMSAMENILLDLFGIAGIAPAAGSNPVSVGPNSNAAYQLQVDVDMLGVASAGTKSYFTPDPKYFVAQIANTGQMGAPGHADAEGNAQLKDLVDAWGSPILGWVQDERAVQPVATIDDFAKVNSGPIAGNTAPARFYWNSNACFLQASALGRKGINQTDPSRGSLLNGAAADVALTMAGILGNPSYPLSVSGQPITLPAQARGPMVFHSAGIDGVYMGRKDKGLRQFNLTARNYIDYGVNHAPDPTQPVSAANRYTNGDGQPTTIDILKQFDDIFLTAGN